MKTRHILNLILVSIVGILIAFTIYEPGRVQNSDVTLVSNYDPQKIKILILERDGSQILKIEKEQAHWFIRKPFDLAANSFQVNALLSIANNHSYTQINAQQHDLEKFGLKNPHISLHYDDKVISFGGTDPLNFRRYVLVDNTVHLINDGSYRYISQDITKFVSYKLLPDDKRIKKIELPGVLISKNAVNGNWDMTPKDNRVSPDELSMFIERWQNVQATDIKPWLADELKQDTVKSINIQFADNSELALVIIDDKSDLILGKNESRLRYELAETIKEKLLRPAESENQP
ncbi:MAG: DUF4340 domain-containing protein [Gammaproteobacteria bacterium]|nr:DUF4340 domain-containing protein [Gammaproteobacteria bacterium]